MLNNLTPRNTLTPLLRDRDPTKLADILWPIPDELKTYWRSEDGNDYIDKWISADKIAQYGVHQFCRILPCVESCVT